MSGAVTEPPSELYWFDGEGNGLEVRPGGSIRLHHGGYVVEKTLRDWLLLAWPLHNRGIHAKNEGQPALDGAEATRPDEKTEEGEARTQAPGGDARDAARYRWLRDPENASHPAWDRMIDAECPAAEMDDAIDAAMSAPSSPPSSTQQERKS